MNTSLVVAFWLLFMIGQYLHSKDLKKAKVESHIPEDVEGKSGEFIHVESVGGKKGDEV